MGQKYLIDTNTVIEYLNNTLPDKASLLIETTEPYISVITRMEMLAWPKASLLQIAQLESFVAASVVFNLEEPVIVKAITIRKDLHLKLPDAIIAATAVVHGMSLITRNIADFKRVSELQLVDPYAHL